VPQALLDLIRDAIERRPQLLPNAQPINTIHEQYPAESRLPSSCHLIS
jgi:hypothetical protein